MTVGSLHYPVVGSTVGATAGASAAARLHIGSSGRALLLAVMAGALLLLGVEAAPTTTETASGLGIGINSFEERIQTGDMVFVSPVMSSHSPLNNAILATGAATILWCGEVILLELVVIIYRVVLCAISTPTR